MSKPNTIKLQLLLLIQLFLSQSLLSQTTLSLFSGNQVLSRDEGSPFIIDTMLTISENQAVTITSGCQLFFAPFAGIRVEGSLIIEGTEQSPVLFSSLSDSLSPVTSQKTDSSSAWHGIIITNKAANAKFTYCTIRNAIVGIASETPHIVLERCLFSDNSIHFTINDTAFKISNNQYFSYPFTISFEPNGAEKGNVPSDTNHYAIGTQIVLPGNTGHLKKRLHEFTGWYTQAENKTFRFAPFDTISMGTNNVTLLAHWDNTLVRKGVPITIGCAGIVAGGFAIYSYQQWNDNKQKFSNEPNPTRQDELNKKGKNASIAAISCGMTAAITVPFSVVLYLRNHLFH